MIVIIMQLFIALNSFNKNVLKSMKVLIDTLVTELWSLILWEINFQVCMLIISFILPTIFLANMKIIPNLLEIQPEYHKEESLTIIVRNCITK